MNILINSIIRPYRFTYNPVDLGCRTTNEYLRTDDILKNCRSQKIYYSYYVPRGREKQCNQSSMSEQRVLNQSDTCLIYAHCNSGCRIEGLQYAHEAIKNGWNVCLFDFAGSGISEGNIVTLGENEARDLKDIVNMIKARGNKKILLWGRSMGAATILFYLGKFAEIGLISGCVLDSPYSDLFLLSKQIAASKTGLPTFIIQKLLDYARHQIMQQHHFDIKQMKPLNMLKLFSVPLMYITSVKDEFVSCSHVSQLYDESQHTCKVLEFIDAEHNSARDMEIVKIGMAYLKRCLIEGEKQGRKQLRVFSKINYQCGSKTSRAWKNVLRNVNYRKQQKQPSQQQLKVKCLRKFKSLGTIQDLQAVSLHGSNAEKIKENDMNAHNINYNRISKPPMNPHFVQLLTSQTDNPCEMAQEKQHEPIVNTLRARLKSKASISVNKCLSKSYISIQSSKITAISRPDSKKKKIQTTSSPFVLKSKETEGLVSFKSEQIVPTPNLLRRHKHTASNFNYQRDSQVQSKQNERDNKSKSIKGSFRTHKRHTVCNQTLETQGNQLRKSIRLTQDTQGSIVESLNAQDPKVDMLLQRKVNSGYGYRHGSIENLSSFLIVNAQSIQVNPVKSQSSNQIKFPRTIKLQKRS